MKHIHLFLVLILVVSAVKSQECEENRVSFQVILYELNLTKIYLITIRLFILYSLNVPMANA